MTTGSFRRGDLRDLGGGAGERRIQHDGGKAAQLLRLQRLTRQVALRHLDAAGEAGVVGGGAQRGCRRRIAFPCGDARVLRQREGDGAAAGEQFRDAPLGGKCSEHRRDDGRLTRCRSLEKGAGRWRDRDAREAMSSAAAGS